LQVTVTEPAESSDKDSRGSCTPKFKFTAVIEQSAPACAVDTPQSRIATTTATGARGPITGM
jgi:hypothetical protein